MVGMCLSTVLFGISVLSLAFLVVAVVEVGLLSVLVVLEVEVGLLFILSLDPSCRSSRGRFNIRPIPSS